MCQSHAGERVLSAPLNEGFHKLTASVDRFAAREIVNGELSADVLWTTDPECVPEGWQLCEPPTPTGWHRYERKRS